MRWATAGIPDTRRNGMHILRHTYASVLLMAGGDGVIKQVSENLGHGVPSFTLDTYMHVLSERFVVPEGQRALDAYLTSDQQPSMWD